jgi:parallel beta-helix repeat protein
MGSRVQFAFWRALALASAAGFACGGSTVAKDATGPANEAGTFADADALLEGTACEVSPSPSPSDDATSTIQNCIDRMGAIGGGTVLLQAGDYWLNTDHLRFISGQHDYVHLKGAGTQTVIHLGAGLPRAAVLVGSDAQDLSVACPVVDTAHAVTSVEIDAIHIVGNLGNPLDCCPVYGADGQTQSPSWLACETYSPGSNLTRNGITIRCALDVRITDVTIENTNSGGIVADHAQGLVVDGAQIDSPLVDCFASNYTEGTVVRNVTCNSPGWAGFNGDPATHLTLEGNTVIGSGTQYQCPQSATWEMPGIYLAGVADSTITDNIIVGSSGRGIDLHGSSRNLLARNHIEQSTKVGIVFDVEGDCAGGSNNNVASENVIVDGRDIPIWAVCPSLGNTASANICTGNTNDASLATINPDCASLCQSPADVLVTTGGCGGP